MRWGLIAPRRQTHTADSAAMDRPTHSSDTAPLGGPARSAARVWPARVMQSIPGTRLNTLMEAISREWPNHYTTVNEHHYL